MKPQDITQRISVRLGAGAMARLDALAATAGTSRSGMVRRLIDAAAGQPQSAPTAPDRDELLAILAARARDGSVSAASTLLRLADDVDPVDLELAKLLGGDDES